MTIEPIRSDVNPSVELAPVTAPAKADTDSWLHVMGSVVKLSAHIAETEFVPKALRGSAPATAAAILYGREVGLPPMTALAQTHIVEGKPTMSAEAMRALILAAGHEIEIVESTGAVCTMRGRRRGSDRWQAPVTWTIDMARAAGLGGKQNWQKYPRAMLKARATAELARDVFPDVIHGFSAIEELDELDQAEPAETGPAKRKTVQRKAKPAAPAHAEDAPPLPGEHTDSAGAAPATHIPRPTASADTSNRNQVGEDAPLSGRDPGAVGGEEEAAVSISAPSSAPTTDSRKASSSPTPSRQDTGAGARPANQREEETTDGTTGNGAPSAPAASSSHGPKATKAQMRMIFGSLKTLTDASGKRFESEEAADHWRHSIAGAIIGQPVTSFDQLSKAAAHTLIDTLAKFKSSDQLEKFLATTVDTESIVIEDPPGYDDGDPVDAELLDDEGPALP